MKAILKSIAVIVGIPTMVAMVYFGFIASDMYVSEAKVAVRSAKSSVPAAGLGALLAAPGLGGASKDSMVVTEYSRSLDMLNALQKQIDFLGHYSADSVDFLSRLADDPDQEELLEYYLKRVSVQHDVASDVLTVSVRAFSPDIAQQLAELVIELNEALVNTISTRMESDAVSSARSEMERAVERVRRTAQDINQFQTLNDSVSPADESTALFSRIAAIEARISETRAEMGETMAFMREDTADVVILKNRLNALERQLRLEKGRVTKSGSGNLGSLMKNFQPLMLEQEIAQQQYASSLAAFEAARIDAQRKKQYLITFVEPHLPRVATEPKRLVSVLTVAVFSFLIFLVVGLLWSALKDHIGH